MKLSIRQKSNIRHFIYYLVNGTLDFQMLNSGISLDYHEYLKTHPDLFYKSCCVFINQEVKLNPGWPDVKKLAQFICKSIEPNNFQDIKEFDDWEIQFDHKSKDLSGSFKGFAHWFSVGQSDNSFIENVKYQDFITDGASFVEQCFVIWTNVVEIDSGWITNQEYAIDRVKEYMKSYYLPDYEDNLEDWECELYMYKGE